MNENSIKTCLDCQKPIVNKKAMRCHSCTNKTRSVPADIRFFKYVEKTPTCWIWKGAKLHNNYGAFAVFKNNKWNCSTRAHRFSYEIHKGNIPSGMSVLHKCDNPPCVNPDHLFIGTHKTNMRDMVKKGRASHLSHPKPIKLTPAIVREIRKVYVKGKHQLLFKRFGVSPVTIYKIAHCQSWKHLIPRTRTKANT